VRLLLTTAKEKEMRVSLQRRKVKEKSSCFVYNFCDLDFVIFHEGDFSNESQMPLAQM
jgi:hypothetical protein